MDATICMAHGAQRIAIVSRNNVLGRCRDHKADEEVDVLHLIQDAALGSGMAGAAPAVVAPRDADAPGRCRS